jgi:hypothetical protein
MVFFDGCYPGQTRVWYDSEYRFGYIAKLSTPLMFQS